MRRLVICFGVLPVALCLLGGCSKGDSRYAVTGKVLYKQQPLDEGIIDFEPLDGQGSKSEIGRAHV